jgi:hypothetical protein
VITRKNSEVNDPVALFFGQFLGRTTQDVAAQAVALLGWAGGIPTGKGAFPLAMGEDYVPPPGNKVLITFTPSGSDKGCWHSFTFNQCDTSTLVDIVNGTIPTPAVKIGDMLHVSNGDHTPVIQEMKRVFNARQGDWIVILPVIQSDTNYVQDQLVKGFCAFQITDIQGPPDKTVTGWVMGGYIAPGAETGGPDYGLRATLPKLVY